MSDTTNNRSELLALTTEIVSAHISNNAIGQSDVTQLIQSVFEALSTLGTDAATPIELHAGRPDQKICDRRLPDLSRRRQEAEDAEAPSDDGLWHDPSGLPCEMGTEVGLSDGRTQLCAETAGTGEEDWLGPQAAHRPAGTSAQGQARSRKVSGCLSHAGGLGGRSARRCRARRLRRRAARARGPSTARRTSLQDGSGDLFPAAAHNLLLHCANALGR